MSTRTTRSAPWELMSKPFTNEMPAEREGGARVRRQATGGGGATALRFDEVAKSPTALADELVRCVGDKHDAARILSTALTALNRTPSPPPSPPQDPSDEMTEVSAFNEEDDLSKEQLQMIKARTMYQMVEEFDDSRRQLLFLTNPQADLIASSPARIQMMLDVLEMPKPSLVINLIFSFGFKKATQLQSGWDPIKLGVRHGQPPFLSQAEERAAEARIDVFMADVLIPLAARTSAVVLCDAVDGGCILSTSFKRMTSVARAQWGGELPFTVLSTTNDIANFYRNPDLSAHWRDVRKASRTWRQHEQKLAQVFGPSAPTDDWKAYDLDPNATCIIMTDCINPKKDRHDFGPFNNLRTQLLRHLSSNLPTLAVKTGMTLKGGIGSTFVGSLNALVTSVQNNTPTLCLDVRARKPLALTSSSREELIGAAKAQVDASCDELLERGVAETLDACTLAFLHDALTGDGNASTTEGAVAGAPLSHARAMPLHAAIRWAREGSGAQADKQSMPRASSQQLSDVSRWTSHALPCSPMLSHALP